MNNELQNKVWAVLPKEVREEVKKEYYDCLHCNADASALELEIVFGEHNLISDTEETANISSKTEPKFKVGDAVEVRNESIKFKGWIYEVMLDGTYDVECYDGNMIHNVKEQNIFPYTEEKNFFVGDKVLISDDPRIGKDFRGRIGTIVSTCGTDKRFVKVEGLTPHIIHISHLAPYIEPKQGSESAENENNGNHNVGSENKQPTVRIYRPNINLTSPSDNQLRIMVAAEAMKGMLANTNIIMSCGCLEDNQEYITKHAVEYADALIKEINGKGGGDERK